MERSQASEGNRLAVVVMVCCLMVCELGQGTWSWSLSFLTCKTGIMQGPYAQAWLQGSNALRILEQGRSPDSCPQSQMLACVRAQSLQSCPTLRPHGLQPTRLLCPWDSPGKDTGVGSQALLQGIFPTQGSNPGLYVFCTGN